MPASEIKISKEKLIGIINTDILKCQSYIKTNSYKLVWKTVIIVISISSAIISSVGAILKSANLSSQDIKWPIASAVASSLTAVLIPLLLKEYENAQTRVAKSQNCLSDIENFKMVAQSSSESIDIIISKYTEIRKPYSDVLSSIEATIPLKK